MESWGILALCDPITGEPPLNGAAETVRFAEGDALTQARAAYQRVRGKCERVCVAATGSACGIAASLAAQLPVDLLALRKGNIFARRTGNRAVDRVNAFARRNLALIASEIILAEPSEAEEKGFVRGTGLYTRKITCDFSGNVYNTICGFFTGEGMEEEFDEAYVCKGYDSGAGFGADADGLQSDRH